MKRVTLIGCGRLGDQPEWLNRLRVAPRPGRRGPSQLRVRSEMAVEPGWLAACGSNGRLPSPSVKAGDGSV